MRYNLLCCCAVFATTAVVVIVVDRGLDVVGDVLGVFAVIAEIAVAAVVLRWMFPMLLV